MVVAGGDWIAKLRQWLKSDLTEQQRQAALRELAELKHARPVNCHGVSFKGTHGGDGGA
jgi:hypothetical protein